MAQAAAEEAAEAAVQHAARVKLEGAVASGVLAEQQLQPPSGTNASGSAMVRALPAASVRCCNADASPVLPAHR